MASADSRDELTCSICLNIYTDPVSLTCGHKFCRLCIGDVLDTQGARRHSCPECRNEFRIKPDLKRTLIESNISESFQSAHQANKRIGIACMYCIRSPVPATKTCLLCEASLCEQHLRIHSKLGEHVLCEPIISLENKKCPVYKETLNYYCCKDTTCIIVSCSLAREDKGHEVETLNEASGKKKEKMITRLISEREEPKNKGPSLHETKRQVKRKAVGVRKQVTTLIRDIREQLEAQEKRVLSEISRQEEQVSRQEDTDLIRQLKVKKEELLRKMGHAEELCNLMDPVTVLNGLESDGAESGDTEEEDEDPGRDDIKVYGVGGLDVGLISVVLHSGLTGIVTKVTRRHHVPESSDMLLGVNSASDILLDANTAGNNASVSDDLKNVSWSEISQNHPETPERFQDYPQVLNSRGFSSGHHYWEVEGSESGIWGVGMAYPSLERSGSQSLIGFNNKSWSLQRWWFNNHYYVIHNSKIVMLPHTPCCQRLGIFLDYEAGRLSFYELCDPIRHLHTFSATFTEPLHAGFGVYVANSWVRMRGMLGFYAS